MVYKLQDDAVLLGQPAITTNRRRPSGEIMALNIRDSEAEKLAE
jgi:hypothetical protein